ncbi:MAG: hypothetical protein FWH11_11160 [Micrococcales bacterium]|nr:hypothetical protein [Micrococcales bacterium]
MTRYLTTRALPVLAAAVLAATLAGCSDDSAQTQATTGSPQTQTSDPAAPQSTPSGSSAAVSVESLVGTYDYSDSILADGTTYSEYWDNLTDEQKSQMGDAGITPTLTLNADMTAKAETGGLVESGTWEINGSSIRLNIPGYSYFDDATADVDGGKLIFETDLKIFGGTYAMSGTRDVYQR